MWSQADDGSVVDDKGRVIFFSTQRFIDDICLGSCCFICGAAPSSVPFNDEHVIPEWLLRRFGLFSKSITLPNGQRVHYDKYKVPCCEACNSLMGREIESPISEIVRRGPNAVATHILLEGPLKFFVWLGLIFLKTHLKDRSHRHHLDARKGKQIISDQYEWDRLHHIHTVVRCFYTGAAIEPAVLGSFVAFKTQKPPPGLEFDFADLLQPQTMLLRLGEIGLVAVFDDSQAAQIKFNSRAQKITAPLSLLQLREVMTELAWLNLHLKERPTFQTLHDVDNERSLIVAHRPSQIELEELDFSMRGELMHYIFKEHLYQFKSNRPDKGSLEEQILTGQFSILFDEGRFIKQKRRRRSRRKPRS
jgi:hypothetical protein